jgi:hypothetical protein
VQLLLIILHCAIFMAGSKRSVMTELWNCRQKCGNANEHSLGETAMCVYFLVVEALLFSIPIYQV